MRNLFYLLVALLFSLNTFGTSPDSTDLPVKTKIYHVNRPVVESIIGVGLFSDYFAISRIKDKASISDSEIATLNTSIIDPIDRWALKQNPADRNEFENLSNYGQIPIFLLPGLLAFNKTISRDWVDLLLMYAEGHTVTFTFYNYSFLGPTFQNKYRPITYYTQLPLDEREMGNNRNSFYSGHVASSAYSTFFMAKVYCDYHPDMGFGKYLWYTAACIPPLVIADFRIRALDHFPSDCAVGLMLGGSIGIIIPALHKFQTENISLGMFPCPQGMGLSVCWKLPRRQHDRDTKEAIQTRSLICKN